MQSIITVEYDNVEEEVRCIRWAAGKTRLALAKYWSSCLIAGIGIVGFFGVFGRYRPSNNVLCFDGLRFHRLASSSHSAETQKQ